LSWPECLAMIPAAGGHEPSRPKEKRMNASQGQVLAQLILALEKAADGVRDLEEEAQAALFEQDDRERYVGFLEQKAILVLDLADNLQGLLEALPDELRRMLRNRLAEFAKLAGLALDLASPFFMATMLHPMEGWEDAPNDLKRLAEELKRRAGEG